VTLQIRSISIYSHEGERRDVKFTLGALNIVTGASKTGKSALLDIVDYCWGRTECTVAEGEIRKAVSWFAVLFDHGGEGVLIARKNPGPARTSSEEIYFVRGVEQLPETHDAFFKNITNDGLKAQLSAILGISENVHVPEERASRLPLEASSRHAILFSLQAQDEIANRRLLFHRQGEQFMPAAIRDVLPYFLGAVDENHFLTLKRYQDARTRLRRLEREYAELEALAHDATNAARSLLNEARRTGLVPQNAAADDAETMRTLLMRATEPRVMAFADIDDPEADLGALEDQRRTLQSQLQDVREEIADIERLNKETGAFEGEAREQQARLASVGLIDGDDNDRNEICPLCESHLAVPMPTVTQIKASLADIQLQLHSVRRDAPRLQERLSSLEAERAKLSDQLRNVQREIARRIQDNERLRIQQNQFAEQARVAGRIAYYLENTQAAAQDSDHSRRIAALKAEIEQLETVLDDDAAEERVTAALSRIGRDLTKYAVQLGLEHGDNPLRLDRRRLTVVADTDDGPLSLAQMGSAENHVGYHVTAHLSLHKLFRSRRRPVPSFLMLDQPSQAHYPPEHDNAGSIDDLADEDQAAVHRLFALLRDYTQTLSPSMQVIVMDHVQLLDDWFSKAISERWRDGITLVPPSWPRL